MSVVFSSQDVNNKSKNGYFRIGSVTLDIPPTNIITDRVVNNNRKQTLRGKNEMFSKSGQSRWDVTISWVGVKDENAADPYNQLVKVQTILAMFKAAPFVEVENSHIRQILAKTAGPNAQRMAFGLRQFKIDTHPDIVDGLMCTLTMTYFNYAPYSLLFGYLGDKGEVTDAYKSTAFKDYLNTWKQYNLVSSDADHKVQPWQNQDKDKIGFTWREYQAAVIPPAVLTANNSTNVTNPPLSTQQTPVLTNPKQTSTTISASNLALINTLDPTAAKQAISWLTDVQNAGYGFSITSATRDNTKQTALYNTYLAQGGDDAVGKPGGPKYLVAHPADKTHKGSNHLRGLALDIRFQGYAGAPPSYALTSANTYGWAWTHGMADAVHWDYTGQVVTNPAKKEVMPQNQNTDPLGAQKLSAELAQSGLSITTQMQNLLNEKYTFDYLLESSAFFYKEHVINLRDKEHETKPHAQGLHPSQISVMFINNLAQIPLAGYQYPTYQHVGPTASLISFQMTSVGAVNNDSEPIHGGLNEITSMSDQLEEQFMKFRPIFRSVKSVHGFQAVYVENSILNMLGIFAIMPEQISTETIQDSSNMVQVTMTAYQYENIFEETTPYKINGITGSFVKGFTSILDNSAVNTPKLTDLSAQEKSQINKVVDFQNNYNAADPNALGKWLISAASNKANGNFLGNLTDNPIIALTSTQMNDVVSVFNNRGLTTNYPCLGSRIPTLGSSNSMTYADYLSLNAINLTANSMALDGVKTPVIENQTAIIKSLYAQILPFIANSDAVFAGQLQKLIDNPTYKDLFSNSNNPSDNNPGHGTYADFGLPEDINPADYFINDNDNYRQIVKQELTQNSPTSQSITTQITNATNTTSGATGATAIVNATSSQITTDPNKLAQMINIPGYSMKEAFPTYKLFFIEDANAGIYYCFDNFYSYASVLDIEVMRPYDKPATAVIRMTNLSNLFNHKIYDHTLVGRYEEGLNSRFELPDNGSTVTTAAGGATSAYHNAVSGTTTMTGRDNREGYGDPNAQKLIGLKYFPLQTGSKIQIRMGFNNDPDKLTVVFTGMVTEIEDTEIGEIQVTAQSYLLELATTSGAQAGPGNSWINIVFDQGKGANYGGISPFTDGGDAQSVIRSLLRNPMAKHFGHFVLNGATQDQLMKGFNGWQELTGSIASAIGSTTLAGVIANGYDRSGENIMVNSFVNSDGTVVAGTSRSWLDQTSADLPGAILNTCKYYIDPDLDWSLWDLIRDVSRRYPEFSLVEKFYGFPYEADATLVFGSPLDWYFTRPALIGDDEDVKNATSDNATYQEWWNQIGKAAWENIYDTQFITALSSVSAALNDVFNIFNVNLSTGENGFIYVSKSGGVNRAKNSFADLKSVDNDLIRRVIGTEGIGAQASSSSVANLRNALGHLEASYIAYVAQQAGPNAKINDGRIKPVRKYHFIDQTTIIHNGIKLNDKIYNAIKIVGPKDKKHSISKASSTIPDHHIRMLDVSSKINDPDQNVFGSNNLGALYGQSFLKEELSKMYRGEIVLRGIPEIEPLDVLILLDPSSSIVGPVEVEQVIHSFSQEMGYITIVKPRCQIAINEVTGASFARGLGISMAKAYAQLHQLISPGGATLAATGIVASTAAKSAVSQVAANALAAEAAEGLGVAVISDGAAVGLAAISGTGVGLAAIAVALLAGAGIYYILDTKYASNPIIVQPLTRFGRVWVGGLQGFSLTGIQGFFQQNFTNFLAEEWYPLLDLYKTVNNISSNTAPELD